MKLFLRSELHIKFLSILVKNKIAKNPYTEITDKKAFLNVYPI